jgi:lysophospholipase L1-like esterase
MNMPNTMNKRSLRFFSWLAALTIFGLLPAGVHAQTNDESVIPATDILAHTARVQNMPAKPKLPSLFLIGDSTVLNGRGDGTGGQWGWGDEIAPFFNTGKINVVNRALGGTTSRTFYRDQWPGVLALLKHGDFVIMQFGTNGGAVNDASRARGEIHGIGDETQAITNLVTGKFEVVHTFGWYEKQMIAEARSKGATPMVCSLIPRNSWRTNGTAARTGTNSATGWARQAAESVNAPFLDINEIIASQYDKLGREKVNALFVAGAGPHTSLAGAQTNAICVIAALKGLKTNPLAKFLSKKAAGIAPVTVSPPAPAPAEDERPVVDASTVPVETIANDALPTFHIIGDSTVRSGGGSGHWGWGERIAPYFNTNKINIVNQAIAGRSARTYFTDGHWEKTIATIKPGDVVIIQFGTNDGGKIGDPSNKNRADGAGIGDETVEDTRPDGTKELVHTFGWYMAQFVTQSQAKGAKVILVSPVPHKDRWETGRDFENFAQWDAEVAKAHNALFFDLTMVVTDAFKKAGADEVATFFSDQRTHATDIGAQFNAACVIAGLKSLTNDPLAPCFSEKAKDIKAWQPDTATETINQ